jgi:hypothetical protein
MNKIIKSLFFAYFSPILLIIITINNSDIIRFLFTSLILVSWSVLRKVGDFEGKICRWINKIKEILSFIVMSTATNVINIPVSHLSFAVIFLAMLVAMLDIEKIA